MELGNFSVSLAVKDLAASRDFYQKLGFEAVMGQADQGWKETMSMQGAEGAALGFEKGKRGVLVNLRPDIEGQTIVSLSLQAP